MPKISSNAEAVAHDVLRVVRKGTKVNLGEIIRKHGYSESISKTPKKITKTRAYKQIMRPIIEGIDKEIERIKAEMSLKDLSKERYETLVRSADILIKNHQLLSGKATENTKTTFEVVNYGDAKE